jgi:hypothetical protein
MAMAKCNARVIGSSGDEFWRRSHETKKLRREHKRWNSNGQRDEQSEKDGLRAGNGGIHRVLLTDAAGDHRGGGHGKTDADRKHQGQQ